MRTKISPTARNAGTGARRRIWPAFHLKLINLVEAASSAPLQCTAPDESRARPSFGVQRAIASGALRPQSTIKTGPISLRRRNRAQATDRRRERDAQSADR